MADDEAGKLEHKMSISVDHSTGAIMMSETIANTFFDSVVQTREQGVREALIKLGWTPPDAEHVEIPPPKLADFYVVRGGKGDDWIWAGKHLGQAKLMLLALRKRDPGARLVKYQALAESGQEVRD